MKRFANYFLLGIVFFASQATDVGAANRISESSRATILKEIDEWGETIALLELALPDGRRIFEAKMSDNQRMAAVSDIQQRMSSTLQAADQKRIIHKFKYTPGIAITVDNGVLERLEQNSYVYRIFENGRRKPLLAESAPLVYPAHSSSRFNGENDWAVAVLDTGVDKYHEFMHDGVKSKVISEACYSRGGYTINYPEIDSLCPGELFSSIYANSGLHCYGYSGCDHGTHVAGIAAGNGGSFNGVAAKGKIIAIQVFTGIRDYFYRNVCGTGYGQNCLIAFDLDILHGLERVYALKNEYKIAAVNLSLGGGSFAGTCDNQNTLISGIINSLKKAGIATVIASGNQYLSNGISFPACIKNAIAVGATYDAGNGIDGGTTYGNQSPTLDVYAPGSHIVSSVPGGGYSSKQGTSMAAPHVAGAWAVMKSIKPTGTVGEFEELIKTYGPNIKSRDGSFTRKRLDLGATLQILSPVLVAPQSLLLKTP